MPGPTSEFTIHVPVIKTSCVGKKGFSDGFPEKIIFSELVVVEVVRVVVVEVVIVVVVEVVVVVLVLVDVVVVGGRVVVLVVVEVDVVVVVLTGGYQLELVPHVEDVPK